MARAKRTERAEARRRFRTVQADQAVAVDSDLTVAGKAASQPRTSLVESLRRGLGQMRAPDVRADARALPEIVRAKPWILVPYGLLLVGAIAAAVTPATGQPVLISYLIALTIGQAAGGSTLLYFAVGFLAPRGAYLFGALLGLFAGVLSLGAFVVHQSVVPKDVTTTPTLGAIAVLFVTDVLSGAIFGWFASWYRDFLRRSQVRSREAAEARKREQRRQARRPESKRAH